MGRKAALFTSTCLILTGGAAFAQSTPSSSLELGEIVVTAQRREEALSKTPVSVAAISNEQLEKANIVSEADLRAVTPGLTVRAGLNSNNLNYAVRGQSQDPYSSTRPGVLPYVNEVQVGAANSAASSAFYDLNSVQVLKGPQGTLFGRSATGGAVLFSTNKPSRKLEGYASGLVGNYDLRKAEGAISGPLVDNENSAVLARVAGFYEERGGYQDNLFDGSEVGEYERYGLRGSLTFEVGTRFTNDLMVDYYNFDGENTVGGVFGLMPLSATPGQPPFLPLELLYAGAATPTQIATGAGTLAALTGVPFATAQAFYTAYYAGREDQSLNNLVAQQDARSPYKVNYDGPNFNIAKNYVITNSTAYQLTDKLTLRNIFGYVKSKNENATDADGTPFAISQSSVPGSIFEETKQLSDEIQLQGEAFSDRLKFTTGLYFSDEKLIHDQDSDFFDILFGGQSLVNNYKLTNKTYAAYGQGTFDLNDSGLALTLGGRYTQEKVGKDILPNDSFATAGLGSSPLFSFNKDETYKTFSWQVGLQSQFTNELLGYVNARRAFKSGGFNGTVPPLTDGGADDYGKERVTDIEAGLKYAGKANGIPVRANIAAYHTWQKDSQRAAFTFLLANPVGLTVNVPKATVWGIEFDGSIKPHDWLTLGAALNYTKAEYGNEPTAVPFNPTANPAATVIVPVLYDQVTDTPEFSGSVYGDLVVPVSSDLDAIFHVDYFYQDETSLSPRKVNNVGTGIDSYGLLNFRFGVEHKQGWSLIANVKNVTDEEYFVGGLPSGEIYQLNVQTPGSPRTYSVEARYRF